MRSPGAEVPHTKLLDTAGRPCTIDYSNIIHAGSSGYLAEPPAHCGVHNPCHNTTRVAPVAQVPILLGSLYRLTSSRGVLEQQPKPAQGVTRHERQQLHHTREVLAAGMGAHGGIHWESQHHDWERYYLPSSTGSCTHLWMKQQGLTGPTASTTTNHGFQSAHHSLSSTSHESMYTTTCTHGQRLLLPMSQGASGW